MIMLTIIFLFNEHASAMEKPKPWYKKIFNSEKKELTPTEKAVLQNQEWITLIDKSWKNKDIMRIKELIRVGVNVNAVSADGNTMLVRCVDSGNIEVARLLLQSGADPNIKNVSTLFEEKAEKYRKRSDVLGGDGLAVAIYEANAALVKKRNTALLAAVLQGQSEFVTLLLHGEADPELKNNYGQNALDIARETGRNDILKILSEYKPRPKKIL